MVAERMHPPLMLTFRPEPADEREAAAREALAGALEEMRWTHGFVDPDSLGSPNRALTQGTADAIEAAAMQRPPMEQEGAVLYVRLPETPEAILAELPLLSLAAAHGWRTILDVQSARFLAALADAPEDLHRAMARHLGRALRLVVPNPGLVSLFDGLVDPFLTVAIDPPVSLSCEQAATRAWDRKAASLLAAARAPLEIPDGLTLLTTEGADLEIVLQAAARDEHRGARHRFFVHTNDPPDENQLPGNVLVFVNDEALRLDLLSRSDVLVHLCSDPLAGPPMRVLEAMRFGLPIVTSRQGALEDLIEEGDNGLFVDDGDPETLLDVLDLLADDAEGRVRMALASRRRSRHHEPQSYARALLTLIDEAATGGARRRVL